MPPEYLVFLGNKSEVLTLCPGSPYVVASAVFLGN